jgi:predicted O-methyltransferase YrrM
MEFIDEKIEAYAEAHTSSEPDYLAELNRETQQKVLQPRMLSGHFQGRILSMLSKLKQPQRILEIGTYTGYSALCLAEGLSKNGKLHTIDKNEELAEMVKTYVAKANMTDKIVLHIGNALEVIEQLNEKWDIVFIDADKENYVNYYHLVIDNMNPGGLIIADNVLWSGKVLDNSTKSDLETETLKQLSEMTQNDYRVRNVLLPVRDGLLIAQMC